MYAWAQRNGSACTPPVSFDNASRVLWSMWRRVVVPAAAVLSSSYGVMLRPMCCGSIVFVAAEPVGGLSVGPTPAGRSAIGILTSRL